jgi:hypothetical protein
MARKRDENYTPPSLEERLYNSVRWEGEAPREIAFALMEVVQRLLREADPKDEIVTAYKDGIAEGERRAKTSIYSALMVTPNDQLL